MRTIKLRLGTGLLFSDERTEVIDVGQYDIDDDTTLKDIAIILYCLCGGGVIDLLAKELSEQLSISQTIVRKALGKVVDKYYNMDDDEAYRKTFPNGGG